MKVVFSLENLKCADSNLWCWSGDRLVLLEAPQVSEVKKIWWTSIGNVPRSEPLLTCSAEYHSKLLFHGQGTTTCVFYYQSLSLLFRFFGGINLLIFIELVIMLLANEKKGWRASSHVFQKRTRESISKVPATKKKKLLLLSSSYFKFFFRCTNCLRDVFSRQFFDSLFRFVLKFFVSSSRSLLFQQNWGDTHRIEMK